MIPTTFYTGIHKAKLLVLSFLLAIFLTACSGSSDSSEQNTDASGTNSGADTGASSAGESNGDTTDLPNESLGPLPNPALSEAPSTDDEPIQEAANFNTVLDLQLVRDPGPRILKTSINEFTDADFDAGPMPAIIQVPDDVDPELNAAPDFENLQNIDAVAGEQLSILFKPIDADGELPGMFPEELAPGSSFDDNFDGSKTYNWQPLENDVGISDFTVTAIDSENSQYRTERTILIRVSLPDDLSNIPNVAPTLDPFPEHTARVNDPVVLELKGIDLNGTVPSLELISELPNSSFVQHPRFEEIYTLRFIPPEEGNIDIQILSRDSIDPTLTSTDSVSVNVLPAASFERTGQRLRDLAAARNIQFGYASLQDFYHRPDGAIYAATAASEFNLVTPENSMKMDVVNPSPGRYQFADTDNLVEFAKQNDMAIHGHPILWHRQLPEWIQNVAPEELEGHMREYIHRSMIRYENDIELWDVVNEPVGDNGGFRDSIWFQAMGESYLDIAFLQARASAPNGILLLNDFDIAFDGPKADTLFNILNGLIEREVPIDGVGFQLHVFDEFNEFDEVRDNFQRVADLDLDIYITELDVALSGNNNLQTQSNVYAELVTICLEQPRCKAIQTWGFTDQYSFRENFLPLMLDKSYQPKPAYEAIQNALSN